MSEIEKIQNNASAGMEQIWEPMILLAWVVLFILVIAVLSACQKMRFDWKLNAIDRYQSSYEVDEMLNSRIDEVRSELESRFKKQFYEG